MRHAITTSVGISTNRLSRVPSSLLEIEMLRRAIRRADDHIMCILAQLEDMRFKQRNRQKELARRAKIKR